MEIKDVRERFHVHDADLTQSRFSDTKLLDSSFVNVRLCLLRVSRDHDAAGFPTP